MKRFIYPISSIVDETDFKERCFMIERNVQKLLLGPIQSKTYFESFAVLAKYPDERDKAYQWAIKNIKRYHGRAK